MYLISYIVICGPRRFLVYLVLNTTWSFLIIALTTCGHFLCASSMTHLQLYLISLLMFPHSLVPPSRPSRETMAVSLTTLAPAPSSSPMTTHLRMSCPYTSAQNWKNGKLNVAFVHVFHLATRSRHIIPPLSSTFYRPRCALPYATSRLVWLPAHV